MTNPKGKEVIKLLEKISSRGYSHHSVFDDWLGLMINALIGDDENYLKIVKRYRNQGKQGKREIDHFKDAFHTLLDGMAILNEEMLGEIYMDWNISNKHTGQFFTPKQIASMMAKMIGPKGSVLDPACGAGIMLVEAAKTMSYHDCSEAFFVGQDLDATCVNMCALNLTFFNLNGYAIQGDSLKLESNWGYRTIRSPFGGSIRNITEEELERIRPKIMEAVEKKQGALF